MKTPSKKKYIVLGVCTQLQYDIVFRERKNKLNLRYKKERKKERTHP